MDATQIVLIVFIVLLIIIYPVMMFSKNKKENQRMLEQTNSLKRGDRVLTTSGVYGTIVDLHYGDEKKIVTIETGEGNKKGYISVDAYAIYKVFNKEEPQVQSSQPVVNAEENKKNKNEKSVLEEMKKAEDDKDSQKSSKEKAENSTENKD